MQIAATNQKSISVEILNRLQIAIFWGICMLLCNTLLAPITDGVIFFSLAGLLELFVIQAMLGLFGDTPLVRDANELSFYSFAIHLVAIPLYMQGVQSDWHNNAVNGLLVLYFVRLFYFGERRADGEFSGWAKFGALSWTCYFIAKFANTITKKRALFIAKIVITIATIAPLWIITVQNNDQKTSLYTVLTTSFILIYGYLKNFIATRNANQIENLLNEETIALCKAYNQRTSDARKMIQRIAVEEFTAPEAEAQNPASVPVLAVTTKIEGISENALSIIIELRKHIRFLVIGTTILGIFSAYSYQREGKSMFDFGYATGYTDGKAGVKAKQEAEREKVMRCQNREWTKPESDKDCDAKPLK